MNWRDFEKHCDKLLRNSYQEPKYKIQTGMMIRTTSRNCIPDFLIERSDGLKVVLDAKCYQDGGRRIHTNTIDDMENYRSVTSADFSVILANESATITDEANDYITKFNCVIIRVNDRDSKINLDI